MIRRVVVHDYMAHKQTTLDLADGVTVITGPNNMGKSALVEAIRSLVQNPPMKHAIRHGAPKAVVLVELDTGEVIQWVRTEKNAFYELRRASDGEPERYAKFGRGVPEDVRKLLRMDPVETESGSVDIHIGNQRYPIFLLDQAGSQAASFFAASTEAAYLLRMQQALKRRADRAKSRRKQIVEKLEGLQKSLAAYTILDAAEATLLLAETLREDLVIQERSLPQLEECLGELSGVLDGAVRISLLLDGLDDLQPPPRPGEVTPLSHTINELKTLQVLGTMQTMKSAALEPLALPPRLLDVSGLERLGRDLSTQHAAWEFLELEGTALGNLQPTPRLNATEDLHRLLDRLSSDDRALHSALNHLEVLGKVEAPPPLHEADQLARSLEVLQQVHGQVLKETARYGRVSLLRPVPEAVNLSDLQSSLAGIEALLEAQQEHESRLSLVEEVRTPPALHPAWELVECVEQLENLERDAASMFFRGECCAPLRQPPELQDPEALISLVSSLEAMERHGFVLEKTLGEVNFLSPPPEPAVLNELEGLLAQAGELESQRTAIGDAEMRLEAELRATQFELQSLFDRLESCPLCGQALNMEHFLRSAHV